MSFTEEKLFLAFLLDRCTKGAVRAVFDRLEKRMGTYEFTSVFKNVLTDQHIVKTQNGTRKNHAEHQASNQTQKAPLGCWVSKAIEYNSR